jgi:hypothetical protein
MSPEEAVTERLLAVPAVTAIVGQRVYTVIIRQSSAMPCVRVQQISQIDKGQHLYGGGGSRGWARVQVDAISDFDEGQGYATVRTLTDAIHGDGGGDGATGLLGWRGVIGPLTITGIFSMLDPVTEINPEPQQQVRIRRDYEVWFAQD